MMGILSHYTNTSPFVVLYLMFDSDTFADDSNSPATITMSNVDRAPRPPLVVVRGAGPSRDTGNYRFGLGSAGLTNGSTIRALANPKLRLAGDFTIQGWVRVTADRRRGLVARVPSDAGTVIGDYETAFELGRGDGSGASGILLQVREPYVNAVNLVVNNSYMNITTSGTRPSTGSGETVDAAPCSL
jgi:hypothetical protein